MAGQNELKSSPNQKSTGMNRRSFARSLVGFAASLPGILKILRSAPPPTFIPTSPEVLLLRPDGSMRMFKTFGGALMVMRPGDALHLREGVYGRTNGKTK